jgi:hypothetical protein
MHLFYGYICLYQGECIYSEFKPKLLFFQFLGGAFAPPMNSVPLPPEGTGAHELGRPLHHRSCMVHGRVGREGTRPSMYALSGDKFRERRFKRVRF